MGDIPATFSELPQNLQTCEQQKFELGPFGHVQQRVSVNPSVRNSILVTQTSVSGTATPINTPDGVCSIRVKHISAGEYVYIGNNASITDSSNDSYPLSANEVIELAINENQDNELYAVSDGTSITLYAIGEINV